MDRVYGTAFNENDLSGYIGLNKKWGYSNLNFSLYNDLQEIPDGSRDSLTRKFTKQITEADTYRPIVFRIGIEFIQNYSSASARTALQDLFIK